MDVGAGSREIGGIDNNTGPNGEVVNKVSVLGKDVKDPGLVLVALGDFRVVVGEDVWPAVEVGVDGVPECLQEGFVEDVTDLNG